MIFQTKEGFKLAAKVANLVLAMYVKVPLHLLAIFASEDMMRLSKVCQAD